MLEAVAAGAEADGNPVIGLLALLRDRAGEQTASWLHRGLTSQDVIDTALMLCLRDALARVRTEIATQVRTLAGLAETHRARPDARPHADPGRAAEHRRREVGHLALRRAGRRRHRRRAAAVAGAGRRRRRHPGRGHRTGRVTGRRPSHCPTRWPSAGSGGRRALAHHPLGDHPRRRRAGHLLRRVGTRRRRHRDRPGPSRRTRRRARAAVRRPCRTRTIRCSRC